MLLLIVEDCFVARGPGVLVSPRFVADEARETKGTIAVRLVRPDGTSLDATATVDIAHMRGALAPWAMYRLHGVTEGDVPPGTAVWTR